MLTFQRQATVADGVVRGRLCDAVNLGGGGGAGGCSGVQKGGGGVGRG